MTLQEKVITRQTRITCQTTALIDDILPNSPGKVSLSSAIDLFLSECNLIYCTRKISLPKNHKNNKIINNSRFFLEF